MKRVISLFGGEQGDYVFYTNIFDLVRMTEQTPWPVEAPSMGQTTLTIPENSFEYKCLVAMQPIYEDFIHINGSIQVPRRALREALIEARSAMDKLLLQLTNKP